MVLSWVRRPSRSASVIIRSTGRSLIEPPGLNHSALRCTSTDEGSPRVTRARRSSGVCPIRSSSDRSRSARTGGRSLVEEIGRLRIVPNPVLPPAVFHRGLQSSLFGGGGLPALQPREGGVEAKDPPGDDVLGDPCGEAAAARGDGEDRLFGEGGKDDERPRPVLRAPRFRIPSVDTINLAAGLIRKIGR